MTEMLQSWIGMAVCAAFWLGVCAALGGHYFGKILREWRRMR